jgi:hypothetical protein
MTDVLTEHHRLYSAAEFRRRALHQSGGPVDHSWRDHGDHILNPDIVAQVETFKLHDAAVLVPVVDDGDVAQALGADRFSRRQDRHDRRIA